jgi:hypothetical protein
MISYFILNSVTQLGPVSLSSVVTEAPIYRLMWDTLRPARSSFLRASLLIWPNSFFSFLVSFLFMNIYITSNQPVRCYGLLNRRCHPRPLPISVGSSWPPSLSVANVATIDRWWLLHIYSWLGLHRHRLLLGGRRSARVRLVHAPTLDFYENNNYSCALL